MPQFESGGVFWGWGGFKLLLNIAQLYLEVHENLTLIPDLLS